MHICTHNNRQLEITVSKRILITVIFTITSRPEYIEQPDVHRSIDYIVTETESETAQLTRTLRVVMEVS